MTSACESCGRTGDVCAFDCRCEACLECARAIPCAEERAEMIARALIDSGERYHRDGDGVAMSDRNGRLWSEAAIYGIGREVADMIRAIQAGVR